MRDSQKRTREKNPVDLWPSPSIFSVRGLSENGERKKEEKKKMKQKARMIKLPLVESYYRDNPVILVVRVVMRLSDKSRSSSF